jgi:hypothetical protein
LRVVLKFVFLFLHRLCSIDIVFGFVGLMFKRLHNESHYNKSVTVTETVFTKRAFVGRLFVKTGHSELYESPTDGLFADVKSQTDGLTAGCVYHVTFS